ncbi:MAG: putative 4-hydroxybenzoate polyprenyltransferase [Planctomycetota bacterium]|nr:putative 4-hydroxybenzoate polyprenyltransferase [Planctomycetota bacterium]MDA1137429.1 putative 4-hydroxybenzoate polyprenyltransferase [Planctomycetota bacterium]
MSIFRKITVYLDLIKFQHTIFALPFAILSAFLAAEGFPGYAKFGWILLAMVGARSAAMAFNRLMDEKYDRDNPRTAKRPLTAGLVRRGEVWGFTIVSIAVFVWAAYSLNPLAFYLSPVALAVILSYSLAKRFTSLAHLWLGLGLAIAPVGAWIAVTGKFGIPPLWLALAVMLWTAGFDIIYSCMDHDYDVRTGLFSIPQRLGIPKALRLSAVLHFFTVGALAAFLCFAELGIFSWTGLGLVACLLAYEHWIVRPDDLGRVNTAFFYVNAIISFGMMCTAMLDIYL